MADDRLFVLMPRGQEPCRDENGRIISSGALGAIGIDNAYLTCYGKRPSNSPAYGDLKIGQVIYGVHYSLSGSSGDYDVWRVR